MDYSTVEQELLSHRPAGWTTVDFPDGFVWPRYEGRSVGNLGATVASLLGAQLRGGLPPLERDILGDLGQGVERIVLLVMDALGWRQLQRAMARHPDLVFHRLGQKGRLLPITTTFLSTTNSVLSSIWTMQPPIRHGLLAYELYLREWSMAVEAIGFSSPAEPFSGTLLRWGFDPVTFLPVPSLAELLASQGISSHTVILKQYTETPLSRMHFRGVQEIHAHSYASDFWVTLRRVLHEHCDERMVLGGYWPAVDTLGHRYGPEDETDDAEILAISTLMERLFLDRLLPEDREGTLLLLTADHGQILTPLEEVVVLEDHPALRDMLWMRPVGESRVPFFYVRQGMLECTLGYLTEQFGDRFVFLTREQVLASGLLGPGPAYHETAFRLGDIVGIARRGAALVADREGATRLAGRHGGLTPEEMLVPLLAVRLDA